MADLAHYEFIFRIDAAQVERILRLSRQQRREVERALGAIVIKGIIGQRGQVLHDGNGIIEEALAEPTH